MNTNLGWIIVALCVGCSGEPRSPSTSERASSPDAKAKPAGPVADAKAPPSGDDGATKPVEGKPVEPVKAEPPKPLPAEDIELEAADGTVVHGVHYPLSTDPARPLVLLFHQAGSNGAEYEPIAPRLQKLGYAALAIDQRSGGKNFGRDNRTVQAKGNSTGFADAYPDLQAAVSWGQAQGYTQMIAWGSSYSAALMFRLASEHGKQLTAALSFSPGEYLGKEGTVAGWAADVSIPIFITSAPGKEVAAAKALADAVGASAEHHVPEHGVHGSSALHEGRNPKGEAAMWKAVETFLTRVAP